MNAAFLLVTTAWFAGDTAAAMPAPAASACCGSTCSSCESDACGCGGHKLLGKLHGMFKKKDSCDTCDTCAAPKCHAPKCHAPKCAAPACAPACAPAPTCAPACNTCDACAKPKFLDRLKACFHHEKSCCDGGCSTGTCNSCADGSCGGGTTVIPKAGETIPTPPKKMPSPANPGGKAPPAKQVRIDNEPAVAPFGGTPAIEVAPNAGQTPPALVPSIESDNLRNPF